MPPPPSLQSQRDDRIQTQFAVRQRGAERALRGVVAQPHVVHLRAGVFARSRHILAYDDAALVGSVYVAWDGAQHAFLLEPTVRPEWRHRGFGSELVRRAADAARDAGCDVMHVDYEAR